LVLRDCGERKLILRAARAAQSKPSKPQDALEMSKQHLDDLRSRRDRSKSLGFGKGASNVVSILIHIAYDPARGHIRTAFWFEQARTTVRQ
jgi:hypothetical protein